MASNFRIERKEAPDYKRFVAVLERRSERSYVPFYEMIPNYFVELSGVEPPAQLDYRNDSQCYLETVGFYFQAMARMGFDLGIINPCGFTGFPGHHPGGKVQAGDGAITDWVSFETYPWPSASQLNVERMGQTALLAPDGMGVWTGGPAPFQITRESGGDHGRYRSLRLRRQAFVRGHHQARHPRVERAIRRKNRPAWRYGC